MKDLFIHLCNFSVITSIAILVAILLRPVLKKGPSFIRCALWALVFLRLLIPVGFSDLPFSVPTVFEAEEAVTVPQNKVEAVTPPKDETVKEEIKDEEEIKENAVVPQIPSTPIQKPVSGTVTESQKPQNAPVTDTPINESTIVFKSEKKSDTIKILSLIWVSGALLMTAYMLVSSLILRFKIRDAIVYDSKIRVLNRDCSPFVFGFFKPIIYIPASAKRSDWEYIIAHESTHIKRLDHIVKPLAFLALCLYWYNPLVWAAYILFSKDIEYACDERTVKTMEIEDKKAYSLALLSVSQSTGRILAPLSFGKVNVKERIKRVMKFKNSVWAMALAAVICISLFVFIACTPDGEKTSDLSPQESSAETSKESAESNTITIYVPDEETAFGSYTTHIIDAEPSAENIVRYCIEKRNFPEGSEMLSFEIRDRVGYLDMNTACYELSNTYHDNFGIPAVEKTFLANLDIDNLVITYDGEELSFDPSGGGTSEGLLLSVEELDVDADSITPDYVDPSMGMYDRYGIIKIQINKTARDFKLLHFYRNTTELFVADVLCELDRLEANKPFYIKRQEFPGIEGKGVYFKDEEGNPVIAHISDGSASSLGFEIIEERVVFLGEESFGDNEDRFIFLEKLEPDDKEKGFVVYSYHGDMGIPEPYMAEAYPYKRPDDPGLLVEIIIEMCKDDHYLCAYDNMQSFEIKDRVGYLYMDGNNHQTDTSWCKVIGAEVLRRSVLDTFDDVIDELVMTYTDDITIVDPESISATSIIGNSLKLYYPEITASGIVTCYSFIYENCTAENLVYHSIEHGIFPPESKIQSFEIKNRIGYLDMNEECYTYSSPFQISDGIEAFRMSFLENFKDYIDTLVITFGGKNLDEYATNVFKTDGINRITFYAYYGYGKGSDVPEDNMEEIINWLATFTVGEKVPDQPVDGDNFIHVEIGYKDGTIVKVPLDTVTVDGVQYYTDNGQTPTPECLEEIFLRILD